MVQIDALNVSEHFEDQPSKDFAPIPAGWLCAMVVSSELKATRAGTGHYLEVVLQVAAGEHQGRQVWWRFNIDNPNAIAVEIGKRELAGLAKAAGLEQLVETADLHGHRVEVKLSIRRSEEYGDSNEVKGCRAVGAGAGGGPSPRGGTFADDEVPF